MFRLPKESSCLVASKRSRHWSASGGGKLRRSMMHLFCRLPLLAVWSLLVIYILYRATSQHEEMEDKIPSSLQLSRMEQEVALETGNQANHRDKFHQEATDANSNSNNNQHEWTTKPSSDYVRQSKVFILIVEDNRWSAQHYYNPFFKGPPLSKSRARPLARPAIPQHIRLLISILDSHRIEHHVDTVGHSGLPELLLNDQFPNSDNRQYSVIVIDNFIKYTKLNRWVRDQLDRHCRSNSIGIITYLQPDPLDIKTKPLKVPQQSFSVKQSSTSTTERSLADQFPLNYKPITTIYDKKTTLCDYQLNEHAPMLRILKRKPDFILTGPLGTDLNQLPWVSMSSNHITYEPMTWARLRPLQQQQQDAPKSAQTHHLSTTNEWSPLADSMVNASTDTHKRDQVANMRKSDGLAEMKIFPLGQQQSLPAPHQQSIQHAQPDNNTRTVSAVSAETRDSLSQEINSVEPQILSMYDRGLYDGIKRVIFGVSNYNWLDRILLLDSIEHLSSGRIISPLERYIQIDIDDIFVAETGKRMNKSDVFALIEMQREFSKRIVGGFKFNLGYSGKYFKRGNEFENLGDEELVAKATEFTWFCHTWSHSKAHLISDLKIQMKELEKNAEFARNHKLPIIGQSVGRDLDYESSSTVPPTYAVAPHHSGVYPIHESLYDAWREVLNVQVTSTEEYPALRPANKRRAFVHKAIKVLPRQTCGLYTHTIYRDKYPGGIDKLLASIRGGELFETVLHNPVNIYMSHMSNYANDRLALYTFKGLLDFVQENTHLQLRYAPTNRNQLGPAALADYYFSLYPKEQEEPLWTNPCNDHRHLDIWAPSKRHLCNFVPQILIVGPQKTGTTALHTFLRMNTVFQSSRRSPIDYEEVQFFDQKHYSKGSDWYFARFRPEGVPIAAQLGHPRANKTMGPPRNGSETIYFDKSATYFDDPQAPLRASSLLPESRIIIMLVDPVNRAYSWYQHMKAHSDPTALAFSFEQVIMASEEEPPGSGGGGGGEPLRQLRKRCLQPGYYSQHIARWLIHYAPHQIIIIDGLWFRHNPGAVMNRLQLLLGAPRQLDYRQLLALDHRKGFYCMRTVMDHHDKAPRSRRNNSHQATATRGPTLKCLGPSKGRRYAPMNKETRQFLNRHYWAHNRQLARLLAEIGQPLPGWLDEAMSIS